MAKEDTINTTKAKIKRTIKTFKESAAAFLLFLAISLVPNIERPESTKRSKYIRNACATENKPKAAAPKTLAIYIIAKKFIKLDSNVPNKSHEKFLDMFFVSLEPI